MRGINPQNLEAPEGRRCLGETNSGTRCKQWAWGGTAYCRWHQPKMVEAKERAEHDLESELDAIAALPLDQQRDFVLKRQMGISLGLVTDQVISPRGDLIEKVPAIKDQNSAASTFLRYTTAAGEDFEELSPEEKKAAIRQMLG